MYFSTVVAVPSSLIYLLVALLEILNPTGELSVDVLQNGGPAMRVRIAVLDQSDGDEFAITGSVVSGTASSADGARSTSDADDDLAVRVEQSDSVAHAYLVFAEGAPPVVLDMSGLRMALSNAGRALTLDRRFDLTLDPGSDGGPGQIYLLNRPPYLILSVPGDSTLLIAR